MGSLGIALVHLGDGGLNRVQDIDEELTLHIPLARARPPSLTAVALFRHMARPGGATPADHCGLRLPAVRAVRSGRGVDRRAPSSGLSSSK